MKILGLSALASRLVSFGPLIARVIPGVLMVVHGWQKLSRGPANVGQGMLASLGVPLPIFMGYVVTFTEFFWRHPANRRAVITVGRYRSYFGVCPGRVL